MSAKLVFEKPPENFNPSTQRTNFLPFRLRQSPYNRRSQVDPYCINTDQLAKPASVDSTELSRQSKRQKICSLSTEVEVAACFITVKDNVLFIKRHAHCSEPSKWGIPGGKLEKDETAHQAVVREIKEETGLHLPLEVKHLGTVYIRYPEVDFIYHMYGHTLSDYPEQIVIDPQEHQEYRWMTLREALQLPLIRGEDECIYLVYGENP
jgi:8-oxo-dGTP diphosphatase